MPKKLLKTSSVTYDDTDTFLTSTLSIDENIHKIHKMCLEKLQYLTSIKEELDLNYKVAAKNHDMSRIDNAISESLRCVSACNSPRLMDPWGSSQLPYSKKYPPSTYSQEKNASSVENTITKQGITHRIDQIDKYLLAAIPNQYAEIK